MTKHEFTSKQVAAIAARGISKPGDLSPKEVKAVCASALTQAEDKKAAKVAKPAIYTLPEGWPRWGIENVGDGLENVYATRNQARGALMPGERVIAVQVVRRRQDTDL